MTADIDWAELAGQYGTPTYVYDGDHLATTFTELAGHLHPALEVFYSLKANPNRGVYDVLHAAGARAEVCSLAELRLVLAAGTDPGDVIFLGPGKSVEEIDACVAAGIHAVVCESLDELELIDRAARDRGARQRVLLRINPAYSVAGSRLTMGGKPRQFGIDEAVALAAGPEIVRHEHLDVTGVQVYLGTRILDADVVVKNTAYVLELAGRMAAATGIILDTVDIGGGLGVAYFDGETDLDIALLAKGLNPLIEEFTAAQPGVRLIMESGRYLTATCGTYLTRVRYVKESMGARFAIADGGTNHHMAAVGIGSFVKRNFPLSVLGRSPGGSEDTEPWTVAGPLCTPNDTIAKNVALPALHAGDLIGVHRSGAYGPSASPVYFLSHGHPAEVIVRHGRSYLVRRRDTADDVLSRQSTHPDLQRPR
jgi:diaminopimelate decarboxylase